MASKQDGGRTGGVLETGELRRQLGGVASCLGSKTRWAWGAGEAAARWWQVSAICRTTSSVPDCPPHRLQEEANGATCASDTTCELPRKAETQVLHTNHLLINSRVSFQSPPSSASFLIFLPHLPPPCTCCYSKDFFGFQHSFFASLFSRNASWFSPFRWQLLPHLHLQSAFSQACNALFRSQLWLF